MSAKAGKRPMRPLSTREKLDAIHRVHDGESKASVARDIGVPESTLRGWCKNEEKIALLSRQSSPETDESLEPQEKKKKMDENVQPFNLSLKPTPTSAGPSNFSPNSEKRYTVDYTVSSQDCKAVPLDLKTKHVKQNSTPPCNMSLSHSEREKNRAELARLSVELGLNRPEMFLSNIANSTNSNMSDLSNIGLLAVQWNHLLLQQQAQAHVKKMPSPVGNTANMGNANGGSLLTTVNQLAAKQSPVKLPNEKISVEESVRYWLNNSTPPHVSPNSLPTTTAYPTSLTTPVTSTTNNSSPMSGMTPEQNAWLLKWYKSMIGNQYPNSQFAVPFTAPIPDKPILYQQLTKDKEVHNAENLTASLPEDRPGAKNLTNSKARAVLDTLLLNNNNVTSNREKDGEVVSQSEAVTHGEKFLKWLESCSEPSVTAMQIMQFRSLLTNVKASADRKNGEVQIRAKMKRK